jgi:hypothetical protein
MEIIEKDMNASLKYDKEESDAQRSEDSISSQEQQVSPKKEMRRRKRHELSVSAAKSMSRHNVNIIVEFS